VFSVVTAPWC